MLQAPTDGSLSKSRRWSIAIASVLIVGGTVAYTVGRSPSTPTDPPPATPVSSPQITTVTALGRLEPQGEVIRLSAPSSNAGNRVEQLLVQEGDRVTAGQVVAILDSYDRLQAAYMQAQEEVKVAEAQLAITQAGAKQGEIEAQRAEIARLEAEWQGDIETQMATIARLKAEVQNAQSEFDRYQSLYQEGAISVSDRDSKRLTLDTAQRRLQEAQAVLSRIQSTSPAELNQARATLDRIAEVRPVDVQSKQAEVDRALAALHQAKAELDQAQVRSPIDGEVLNILTRMGEVVSSDGITEVGQTQRMYVVAEVYQSDIQSVEPGQRVRITSDSIPGTLTGTVKRIDSQVQRQTIVNTDPSTNIDARVIEVHIALDEDSSQKASKFTNLQVTAVIEQ